MNKYQFTQIQFDEIKVLLKKRISADADEQKKIRAKIRKLGFMISDYWNGFSDIDFQNLLNIGSITIIDNSSTMKSRKSPLTHKFVNREVNFEDNKIKISLPAIVDNKTTCLILGTMPGERSLVRQEYYTNPANSFWKVMSLIFNNGEVISKYNDRLELLKVNKIGLWDVLQICDRNGSLDKNITNEFINNFDDFFNKYANIDKVIFNGKESYKYFKSLIKNYDKEFIILPSTSSTNSHKTINEKVKDWADVLLK